MGKGIAFAFLVPVSHLSRPRYSEQFNYSKNLCLTWRRYVTRDTKNSDRLSLAAAMATSCVYAADGQPLPTPKVNEITQKVWANPDLTEPTKGIRTLQDYIVQEKNLGLLFQNHPIFATYGKDGRVIGTPGYLYPRL